MEKILDFVRNGQILVENVIVILEDLLPMLENTNIQVDLEMS
jgi:hypothetical protein